MCRLRLLFFCGVLAVTVCNRPMIYPGPRLPRHACTCHYAAHPRAAPFGQIYGCSNPRLADSSLKPWLWLCLSLHCSAQPPLFGAIIPAAGATCGFAEAQGVRDRRADAVRRPRQSFDGAGGALCGRRRRTPSRMRWRYGRMAPHHPVVARLLSQSTAGRLIRQRRKRTSSHLPSAQESG